MLFHNARLAVCTLILALLFALGARVSPAQEPERPAAYLTANSLRGIELFALYADGSIAETPVLLEDTFMYGSESFRDWSIVIEVPDGFLAEEPKLVGVDFLSLSPNATRIAYFWASISQESEEKREPEGITVVDLTNAVTRGYPLSTFPVDMPQWSPDSQAFLLDQHKVDPDIYRVDFFDYATGKFQTVIDGFNTFHVVRYWITPEQFLILEWPEIYLGDLNCVCTELLIAVDEDLVGASEIDVHQLGFGRGVWSSRDKRFYLTISDVTEDSIPNIFAGLYALDLDGELTRILEYQTLYAGDPLQNAPFILTDTPYGSLNLLSTTNSVFHRIDRLKRWDGSAIHSYELEFPSEAYTKYALAPNAKHIALVGQSPDREDSSSTIYVVKLGDATFEVATTGVDPLCNVFWLDSTSIVARPGSGWLCKSAPLTKLLWLNIESGEEKSISLPDEREFWLIMPQSH